MSLQVLTAVEAALAKTHSAPKYGRGATQRALQTWGVGKLDDLHPT